MRATPILFAAAISGFIAPPAGSPAAVAAEAAAPVLASGLAAPRPAPVFPNDAAALRLQALAVAAMLLSDGPAAPPPPDALGRLAFGVEGAESSWGADPRMWRPDPAGPQGPMQVSLAAALDVGGQDRLDPAANRAIGRAYLFRLYRHFGDWEDAVAAYNWGPARLGRWIAAGRPADRLPPELAAYVGRVLNPMPDGPAAIPAPAAADIKNPALRAVFLRNQSLIAELRQIEDRAAPASGSNRLSAAAQRPDPEDTRRFAPILRALARRPGYEEFRILAARAERIAPRAVRDIAAVLIAKLERHNAAIAAIDRHAGVSAPRQAAGAGPIRPVAAKRG